MLRANQYFALKKLAERVGRAAGDATAMLVSGKSRLDVELRRLCAEAGEEYLALTESLLHEGQPMEECGAVMMLGNALCRVLEAALETATLLRGRSVRVWALFDRVRVSATLTDLLVEMIDHLEGDRGKRSDATLREFSEVSLRLAALGMRSFEDVLSCEEGGAALLLCSALNRWRSALCAAHAAAVTLLAA